MMLLEALKHFYFFGILKTELALLKKKAGVGELWLREHCVGITSKGRDCCTSIVNMVIIMNITITIT